MKIILFFLSIIISTAVCNFPLYAQNQRTARGLNQYFSDLDERLKLTDEQKIKIRVIIELNQDKQRALYETYRQQDRGEGRPDMDSLRKKMRENYGSLHRKLRVVLTTEQMTVFQNFQDEQRRKRRRSKEDENIIPNERR